MTEQRMNYKKKYGDNLLCPLCSKSDERTKHVLNCERMPQHRFVFFNEDRMQTDSMDYWQELIHLYESSKKMRIVANVGTLTVHSNQLRAACVQTLINS